MTDGEMSPGRDNITYRNNNNTFFDRFGAVARVLPISAPVTMITSSGRELCADHSAPRFKFRFIRFTPPPHPPTHTRPFESSSKNIW